MPGAVAYGGRSSGQGDTLPEMWVGISYSWGFRRVGCGEIAWQWGYRTGFIVSGVSPGTGIAASEVVTSIGVAFRAACGQWR